VTPPAASCAPAVLEPAIGPLTGASGVAYVDAFIVNGGDRDCVLRDYPEVMFVDDSGHGVAQARPVPDGVAAQTVVGAGHAARFQLAIPEPASLLPGARCAARSVDQVVITPPGTSALSFDLRVPLCSEAPFDPRITRT
jgi:hypothetical protein